VHPNYPVACTDDLEPLINPDTNEFLTIKTLTDFDWLANEATQEQLDFLENCPVVPWTLYDPMGLVRMFLLEVSWLVIIPNTFLSEFYF
jgi:hypothetical protein